MPEIRLWSKENQAMTMSAKSSEQTQRRDYSCPKWRPLLNLGTYEQNFESIYIYNRELLFSEEESKCNVIESWRSTPIDGFTCERQVLRMGNSFTKVATGIVLETRNKAAKEIHFPSRSGWIFSNKEIPIVTVLIWFTLPVGCSIVTS